MFIKSFFSRWMLQIVVLSVLISCGGGGTSTTSSDNSVPVAPSITTQPQSQTVTVGQTATFTVAAAGTAPLSYQWKQGAANVGTDSSSYTTPPTAMGDSGEFFSVVVTNAAGAITSSTASLTVSDTPVAPSTTTQPQSQTVTVGQTATFTVAATGTAPLSYQWLKNGVNITGAASSTYSTPATTTADNGAQFRVIVTNAYGNVTSNAATLTVTTSSDLSVGFIFSRQMAIGIWEVGVSDNERPLCRQTGPESEEVWCKDRINKTIEAMKALHADAVMLNVRPTYFLAERWPNHPCNGGAHADADLYPGGPTNVTHACNGSAIFGDMDKRASWGYLNWMLGQFKAAGINAGVAYAPEYNTYLHVLQYDQANSIFFGSDKYDALFSPGGSLSDRIDMSYPDVRNFHIDLLSWVANNHPDLKGIKYEEPGYWMATGITKYNVYLNPDGTHKYPQYEFTLKNCEYYGYCASWSQPILDYVNATHGYVPTPSKTTDDVRTMISDTGVISTRTFKKWTTAGLAQQNDMIEAMSHQYDLFFEGVRNKITRYYPDFYLFGEFQRYNYADPNASVDDRSLGINATNIANNRWVDIVGGEYGGNGGGMPKEWWCNEMTRIENYTNNNVLVANITSFYQSGVYNNYALDQINYTRTCRPNTFERIFEWRWINYTTGGNAEIKANPNVWLKDNPPPPPYGSIARP